MEQTQRISVRGGTQMATVQNRQDLVLLFDVTDGNPNGDPDAGNQPRLDPETMQGLVSDVCIKRKVRDYVGSVKGGEQGYDIYVKCGAILNQQNDTAYQEIEAKTGKEFTEEEKGKGSKVKEEARAIMCRKFYDVRTFGAVMSTGVNCGQVRGPVQMTFSRSLDAVLPMDVSITRVAYTQASEEGKEGSQMGRKNIVPYGLYRGYGFFSPSLAQKTGFTDDDLALFYEALENMFELDRSASRGMMVTRGLYVFEHESAYGNAHAHELFERIAVAKRPDVTSPRSFQDYQVHVDDTGMPQNVSLNRVVG